MLNNKKVLGGVVLVAVLIIGGYFIWKAKEKPEENIPVVADETANWKTYTNNEGGYSIKYPTGWYIGSSNPAESLFIRNWEVDSPPSENWKKASSLENIDIDIGSYPGSPNPFYANIEGGDEALADRTKDMTDKQTITINGIKAIRGYESGEGGRGQVRFIHDGVLYFISYEPYQSKLVPIFNNILSTFKFTK